MKTMFLDKSEIAALTDRTKYKAQVRILSSMQVTHLIHPDGRPKVLRSYAEELFGNTNFAAQRHEGIEPKWGAMDAT